MMHNRDASGPSKRAERQTREAGKRPYHRVPKSIKSQTKAVAEMSEYKNKIGNQAK
jgi:hypothetical protein